MKEQLEAIRAAAKQALSDCADSKLLETLRVQYLGKKGELTGILKQMGKLSAEERPAMGQLANQVRADIENALAEKQKKLADAMLAHKLESETLDITLPGKKQKVGSMHPLTIVENEIREIFLGMGFSVADGPEVEYDYYNFEALNLPPDHPARAAYPDLFGTGTRDGKPEAADPCDLSGTGLPFGCCGCHTLSAVPSDRGTGRRQGHHHGRSEGYSGTADAASVRR